MTNQTHISNIVYSSLSKLLEYPQAGTKWLNDIDTGCRLLQAECLPASKLVEEFREAVTKFSQAEMEETFTRTFDLAPVCLPYVSSYVHGNESYDRGDFMAKLVDLYDKYNFKVEGELPDHLAVLLRFASSLNGDERTDFVRFCLLEPVQQMAESMKDRANPFSHLMQAIYVVLQTDIEGRY
jgi:nitrate reductase molybdenum cofactor assembly chaperone